jgi:hypothetical protein
MPLANILNHISMFSGLFPVAAALYNYKHLDRVLRIVGIFFIISSFFDFALFIIPKLGVNNNSPAIHLFVVVSVVFYGLIYYRSFHISLLKKITVVLSILTLFAIVYNAAARNQIMSFPTVSYTFLSVVLNILSLLFFYQLLNNKEFTHIEKQPMFWINSGVLFYFSINIFLFMLFNRMLNLHGDDVWLIHDITNIIANLIFSVGLLCKPQTTT